MYVVDMDDMDLVKAIKPNEPHETLYNRNQQKL